MHFSALLSAYLTALSAGPYGSQDVRSSMGPTSGLDAGYRGGYTSERAGYGASAVDAPPPPPPPRVPPPYPGPPPPPLVSCAAWSARARSQRAAQEIDCEA